VAQDDLLSDKATMSLLGDRLTAYRLQRNWTQARLADESDVSKRTIERLEAGGSVQLTNWLRVLRTFGLLSVLVEQVLPSQLPSPIDQLHLQGKNRQRASSPRVSEPQAESKLPRQRVIDKSNQDSKGDIVTD
jgi:putative transcriptional regulator